jgi:KaiC/GvpD/RAD55 family RecA-like ATPase
MIKPELVARSPLRILEKSIHGGLGKGNIGVLAARKGVGKTACLVHLATDKLLQDKPVIHVSYASRVDHIITWYEDIFKELARQKELEPADDFHDEVVRRRVIMNFKQDAVPAEQVLRSVEALITAGNFTADTVIVDGFDFGRPNGPSELRKFREFARRLGLEIWFSASLKGEEPLFDEQGLPRELESYGSDLDVLITLRAEAGEVRINLVKDHDHPGSKGLHLHLDPRTLLIVKET